MNPRQDLKLDTQKTGYRPHSSNVQGRTSNLVSL